MSQFDLEHVGDDSVATPLVSVVMVTFNHERYLSEAVNGILMQVTDFPFELLIGDDCSSDGTLALALALQRKHPRIIRVLSSERNTGLSKNYARLIRASRGEFIAYCEGDDFWTRPDKLTRQVAYLQAHPDTGAVHTDFDHIVWRNGSWVRHANFLRQWNHGRPIEQGNVFRDLLRRNVIQACTLCFRAELGHRCLEEGGLKVSYVVNDWPLCLYIAAHSKIAFFDESTAVYRKVPGSITNSGYGARVIFLRSQIDIVEDVCVRFGVDDADRVRSLSGTQRALASVALLANDASEFDRTYSWLQANAPEFTRSWRGRLLPWIAKSRLGRASARFIHSLRVRLREATEYR